MELAERLKAVQQRIHQAALRVGRRPAEIELVAVSKNVEPARIREAFAAGQRLFGENRVQELVSKARELADLPLQWHMVGHLQRNKVKDVIGRITLLHALDSLRLAEELDRRLSAAGRRLAVLLEVNVSGEPTKFGVLPEEALEAARAIVRQFPTLELQGLMTIGPNVRDEEAVRRAFRRLRELFGAIRDEGFVGAGFRHLSMGMSADFEWAIEEGATMVRIGSAIFGPRPAVPAPPKRP